DRVAGYVLSKRRDLDRLVSELDVGQPEPAPDDPAVPEQALDLVRVGVRTDVEIFGMPAEEQVANAAAYEISNVAVLLKSMENPEGIRVNVPARDRMICARDNDRCCHEA